MYLLQYLLQFEHSIIIMEEPIKKQLNLGALALISVTSAFRRLR